MIRRPTRSTRTDTLFPSRRSSDLHGHVDIAQHNVGDVYQWCGRQLAKIAGGAGDILDHQRADDMRRRRGRNVDVMVDFHTWQLLKGAARSTLLGVSSELARSGQRDRVQAIRVYTPERKRVGAGKSVSVRVELGGWRFK